MSWNAFLKLGLKKVFRGFALAALVLVLLAVFSLIVEPWMLQIPYRLGTGWFGFVSQKVALISIDPLRCVTGVILGGVAVAGMHGLLRTWRGHAGSSSVPWLWRWSLAIASVMLALGVAAVATTGAFSQLSWLKSEPKIVNVSRSEQMTNASNARQLIMVANLYADEHQGKYPESLSALAKWAVAEEVVTSMERLLFFAAAPWGTPEPWLYFGNDPDQSVSRKTVFLASPRAVRGRRIVGDRSCRVEFVEESRFEEMIKRERSP